MSDLIFLLLLLTGHLLGDFYLQPNRWVEERVQNRARSAWLPVHVLVHTGITAAFVTLYAHTLAPVVFAALVMFVSHYLIDLFKAHRPQTLVWFLLDQLAHLTVIGLLWLCLTEQSVVNAIRSSLSGINGNLVLTGIAYLLVMKPASVLISTVLGRWADDFEQPNAQGNDECAKNAHTLASAGEYIGYLERGLIVTFVLVNQIAAVGFILAAKSVFRFGDLNGAHDRKFTEYVMLGTLISIAFALVVGLLTAKAIGIDITK
ncbi:DUF3307 domain-containing protein [Ferrimonas kyonanensis]|uniref:DUF3307 domain-containing protein n=1 Tax=Ferrimonas kyonanensis TaxID=364763 RepID=UPI0004839526|nr:DUF3307 domain-containing protein [Ferrimonas kyonanensis]